MNTGRALPEPCQENLNARTPIVGPGGQPGNSRSMIQYPDPEQERRRSMLKIFFAAIAVLGLMLVGTANAQSCSPTLGGGYRCSDGTTMSPTLGGGWRMNNGTTWSPTLGGGYRSSEGKSLNPTLGGGWRTNHGTTWSPTLGGGTRSSNRHHLLADAWRRIPLQLNQEHPGRVRHTALRTRNRESTSGPSPRAETRSLIGRLAEIANGLKDAFEPGLSIHHGTDLRARRRRTRHA